MMRTIIVRRNYLHFVNKYQRYRKRHSNIAAHIFPCFRVKEGDHIIIGQCRPLSKTVRFNVLKVRLDLLVVVRRLLPEYEEIFRPFNGWSWFSLT
ncbi:hypothetical protein I3843_16G116100 [Carya illinoinensis]|nr:hypothetical protein I3843_16G116100 [Carya illinoinensis]